jgi:hypothetical protein
MHVNKQKQCNMSAYCTLNLKKHQKEWHIATNVAYFRFDEFNNFEQFNIKIYDSTQNSIKIKKNGLFQFFAR